MTQPTCQERVAAEWTSTDYGIRALLLDDFHDGDEHACLQEYLEDYGYSVEPYTDAEKAREVAEEAWHGYGLAFDYVPLGTFDDQTEAYWRFQISYGGPSSEIRFYTKKAYGLIGESSFHETNLYARVEFWFLDWFDGASVDVTETNSARAVWDWFDGCGMVESSREAAMEDVA